MLVPPLSRRALRAGLRHRRSALRPSQTLERRLDRARPGRSARDLRAPARRGRGTARARAKRRSTRRLHARRRHGLSRADPFPARADRAGLGRRAHAQAFDEAYRAEFGNTLGDIPVVIVNLRTVVQRQAQALPHAARRTAPARAGGRRARAPGHFGGWHDTPIYRRDDLAPGMTLDGPAIVEQSDTTTVIEPGMALRVDALRQPAREGRMMDPGHPRRRARRARADRRRDGPASDPRRDLADHLRDQRLRQRHLPSRARRDDRAGPLRPAGVPRLHAVHRAERHRAGRAGGRLQARRRLDHQRPLSRRQPSPGRADRRPISSTASCSR